MARHRRAASLILVTEGARAHRSLLLALPRGVRDAAERIRSRSTLPASSLCRARGSSCAWPCACASRTPTIRPSSTRAPRSPRFERPQARERRQRRDRHGAALRRGRADDPRDDLGAEHGSPGARLRNAQNSATSATRARQARGRVFGTRRFTDEGTFELPAPAVALRTRVGSDHRERRRALRRRKRAVELASPRP